MKKIFTLLLAVAASVVMMQADIVDGTCGDNLTWLLNTKDSTLTISGSGEMTSTPWSDYKSYIKYVTLPDGLTSISDWAFSGCSGLTSVTNYATTPQEIFSWVFDEVDKSSFVLYVPKGSVDLYKAADVWKDFGSIIGVDVPEGIEEIPSNKVPSTKLLRNGNVYILTDDKTYTITGQLTK